MNSSFLYIAYLFATGIGLMIAVFGGCFVLSWLINRNRWQIVMSTIMFVISSIPMVILGVFWYLRQVDYGYAIRGPGIFSQLGSGPWLVTVTFYGIFWLLVTMTVGIVLLRRGKVEF